MSETIRERKDIPLKDTWALEDLYATDADWEKALARMQARMPELSEFEGKLAQNGQTLCAFLALLEELDTQAESLGNYAMRRGDQDTRDANYQAMNGKFISAVTELSAGLSFATPEIMAIPEESLEGFYADCPRLERYRRYLTDQRRKKVHTLSAAEERLLAAAAEMAGAPDSIYSSLLNADLTYPDAVDSEGKPHSLSQSTFVPLEESGDRVLRKSAYENLYHTLNGMRNTAAGLLDAQNKQQKFYATARKYSSAREAALDGTNVPLSVYDNLIEAVHRNLDKMHRYVRLRKKLLGVEQLHFYDIYTPLVQDLNKSIPYEQAKQTVYDALHPLGEDYRKILKEGFDNRWIDVYENRGKRTGAYSAGTKVHPYVLLNYTGSLDSEFTLAHEMGHALHSYLSNKHQNPIDSDYVIFVAEVASTCNEALMLRSLQKKFTDPKAQAYLLVDLLEKFRTTVYRQTMFAEFERISHDMAAKGEPLTKDALNAAYYDLNQKYYGGGAVVDRLVENEWMRIPHFYRAFYVFVYATGFCAAMALSQRIMQEGESAVQDYRRFLSAGSSVPPLEALKLAGVDMTSPEPVRNALKIFQETIDQFRALNA